MRNDRTFSITFCAMLAALSVVLLLIASFLPSGQLGMAAIAGLLPAAAVISAGGRKSALICYVVTALLGFLLLPTKAAVLLYTVLFGHYAVVKSLLEQIKNTVLMWVCKLIVCNALFTVLICGFSALFLGSLPERLQHIPLLYLGGSIAFVIYDLVFSMLIRYYRQRIGPYIRR